MFGTLSLVALRRAIVLDCTSATPAERIGQNWTNIVEEHVAVWRVLDDGQRELLEATSDSLLRHKQWQSGLGEVKVS